ncbi:MAG: Na+/H+ antiporter NhaC family protein [Gemmatimonadales bacterium]
MSETHNARSLAFYGGTPGALVPFALFLGGVAWLAFAGAPNEKGFWPVLLAALALGLLLARDRTAYAETVIDGMSRRIVMLMVMAWLLAGVLGALMNASSFVDSLVWIASRGGVSGRWFVAAAFLVCCAVSTSTGTSFGTILLAAPLLYPAGGALGASPPVLIGAILGGATFGDNISPVSDTTIASATSQGADVGGVVRSRMKYALPAAGIALVLYVVLGDTYPTQAFAAGSVSLTSGPKGLLMLVAPTITITALLASRHLLEGLIYGVLAAVGIGLAFGLFQPVDILAIDPATFSAHGLIIEGMERGVGISIFTILLMGLVGGLEATGVLDGVVHWASTRATTARGAELWIFTAVSAAVVLTTHSVVAILTAGKFTRDVGETYGISAYRRANLLDITVCTYPFLFPFFIPTILAASTTTSGADFGMPPVSPLATGLHNFHSWALLAVVVVAVVTGWGGQRAVGQGGKRR